MVKCGELGLTLLCSFKILKLSSGVREVVAGFELGFVAAPRATILSGVEDDDEAREERAKDLAMRRAVGVAL